jgi:hypothetical protein
MGNEMPAEALHILNGDAQQLHGLIRPGQPQAKRGQTHLAQRQPTYFTAKSYWSRIIK